MTSRFEQELSGALGAFWKKHAEEEIAKMQKRVDNDEIRTNIGGGAFWLSNGRYLPEDAAEVLAHTDFTFSMEETNRARKEQDKAFFERYTHKATEEERMEMRAAFGAGTTVVNVITGERIRV